MDSLHIWLFFHCKYFATIVVNANENKIPQIFLFRAKKYRKYFAGNGTPGCTCLANQFCWMNLNNFFKFLKYFVYHTRCTWWRSVQLDNHKSYLPAAGIVFAKSREMISLATESKIPLYHSLLHTKSPIRSLLQQLQ